MARRRLCRAVATPRQACDASEICALHRLAINKGNWDPDTAAYLARKQTEGKSRKEALRCLKRHLAPPHLETPTNAGAARGTRRRTIHDSPTIAASARTPMPCLT